MNESQVIEKISSQLKNQDLSEKIIKVLRTSTKQSMKRATQEVVEKIKEDANPFIQYTLDKTSQAAIQKTQLWIDTKNGDLTVFPEGSRYIFRDSNVTLLVVEQKPQVRTINLNFTNFTSASTRCHYYLAFPYVQFFLRFKFNTLEKIYVVCSKNPMSKLTDKFYEFPLTNVNDNLVCMGTTLQYLKADSLVDKVNDVISQFWQSTFTLDHSSQFLRFLQYNFPEVQVQYNFPDDEIDNASGLITALGKWQTLSKENVLAAVSDALKFKSGDDYQKLLEKLKGNNDALPLSNVIGQIVQNGLTDISVEVRKILMSLNLEDQDSEKIHADNLQQTIKEIIVAAYAECWKCCQIELEKEKQALQEKFKKSIDKLVDETNII